MWLVIGEDAGTLMSFIGAAAVAPAWLRSARRPSAHPPGGQHVVAGVQRWRWPAGGSLPPPRRSVPLGADRTAWLIIVAPALREQDGNIGGLRKSRYHARRNHANVNRHAIRVAGSALARPADIPGEKCARSISFRLFSAVLGLRTYHYASRTHRS
jgi:hypothetical protein